MSKKILIIDDSEEDRDIVRRFLMKAHFKDFLEATSGEQGIDVAKAEQPAVIILDTLMPGIDGFETCQRIRSIENLDVKIIICTNSIDAVDAVKAKEMGADEYCVKTHDCVSLVDAVRSLI